ncbi:MAG: sigma-70 family RNA polymerase sigma factor [bacterium]|nr:sigma-70 family RNA polymerase sigma factor [bacterium]
MKQQSRTADEARVPGLIDEQSLEGLYESYNRPLYNFFANRGFSREESRDLVQETFLEAFNNRSRFRGDSSPGTWLFSLATNVWRMTLRDQGRLKRDAQVVPLDGHRVPADAAQENRPLKKCLADERTRLLWDALDEMPEKMRLCVVLRLREELKYREIAEILKVTTNTVRSQLFEAREKLRAQLADDFNDLVL